MKTFAQSEGLNVGYFLSAAQMRAAEKAAIDGGLVSGCTLMERAGQGVVDAMFAKWPALQGNTVGSGQSAKPQPATARPPEVNSTFQNQAGLPGGKTPRAVVLCGPGNNGGDGYVIARLLHERGLDVHVYALGDVARLPEDAALNYRRWCTVGSVAPLQASTDIGAADVVIDALFGIGLTRAMYGVAQVAQHVGQNAKWVAVDVPSGLCADSGRPLGKVLSAALTVTFHTKKLGHVLEDGPKLCGEVVVCDIGLSAAQSGVSIVAGPSVNLAKSGDAHKFSHGHALVLSGGPARTGAARLAARAALRVGAGLVTLAVPPAAQLEVASQVTSIMLTRVGDAEVLRQILSDSRINAICAGPALGLTEREAGLVQQVVSSGRIVVLDADALTLVARDPELFDALQTDCVLTPHGGEFARLFPDIAHKMRADVQYSKLDATREAAERAGCVVLYKGHDTVIATPDGQAAIHSTAGAQAVPWLATAGSGDVLAGLIAGIMARGFAPFEAAQTGAWLHAQAARQFGAGLIAEDLPDLIPEVLRDVVD